METKVCCRCGRELPKTREYFRRYNRSKDGFQYHCKECAGFRFGKPWVREMTANSGIKKCTKCGRELPLEMFTKLSRTHDGYHSNCKDCKSQYEKQYKNRDRKRFAEYSRQYRKDNEPVVNAGRRKLYEESEDKRDRCNMEKEKRRSLKNQLDATLTPYQWGIIKELFGNRCAYCGKKLPLQQDHFVPLSKMGSYTHTNILPACKGCNCSKQAQDPFVWYPKFRYYSKKREAAILKFLGYANQETQQPALMI